MVGDDVNACDDGREPTAAGVPAEDVVIGKNFRSAAFDESDGGEEPPVELLLVGCEEKLGGVLVGGTDPLTKERFDAKQSSICMGSNALHFLSFDLRGGAKEKREQ